MKPDRTRAVRCSAVLGVREMARLMALTRGITQAIMALQRSLVAFERRQGGYTKWLTVERATTRGANVRLLVKPSKAATDLLAAGKALCENKRGVHRSARAQRLLRILQSDEWLAHTWVTTPNDPSSATRPTGRNDCNRDAPAGFAAAHG